MIVSPLVIFDDLDTDSIIPMLPLLKVKITDELGSIDELNQEWPGYIRKKIHWETIPLLIE